MDDWREIPMAAIDWQALKDTIGRSRHVLRHFSEPAPSGLHWPAHRGRWSDLSLGSVADMGEKALLREPGFGGVTISALQKVIDMACDGRLPLKTQPAPDALRPTAGSQHA